MSFDLLLHAELGYVEVRYHGHLKLPQLVGALQAIAAELHRAGLTRLLADCQDTLSGPSASEMYEAVSGLRDAHQDAPAIRQALVLPASAAAADMVSFWETLGLNRGMHVQSFATREAAKAWLLQD